MISQELAKESNKRARPVKPAAGVGVKYRSTLRKLNRDIKRDIDTLLKPALERLAPEYTRDSWSDSILAIINQIKAKYSGPQFTALAKVLASQFVRTADDQNRRKFNNSMNSVGLNLFGDSPSLVEYVNASINANTQLITSIPSKYLEQVETLVMANTRAGLRPSAISKQLQKQFNISENRAKLIARDQTSKLSGDLSERRQRDVGYEYFQWVDSDDERVRDRHSDIADKVTAYGRGIYRWDNLPLSSDGVPIKPGQDFQCRCIARPVSNVEVEKNQKEGRVNPSVKR